ncbi:MAG: DNA alkylation repair protein [Anaerolineales bacterium]|nr:MAG: DNA alkylation repair protein [Anaerolineales bacterium]
MRQPLTASSFIKQLKTKQSDLELQKIQRYFKSGEGEYGEGDAFLGVRMGDVFALAKQHMGMPAAELEKLMEHKLHEVRAGAMSIMDKDARSKKTTAERRTELYKLYMRRHDRINNWDLVDLAAVHVVGGYLHDKPRKPLYTLARSRNMWERRTAIVATGYFLRHGDVDDTFTIAEMLMKDKEDLIHKAAGGWLRFAGDQDPARMRAFLDTQTASMPRTMLRYAIEHLKPAERKRYMAAGK